MSFKARLLFALLALGMGAAVLSRGSSLPVLTTPSTSVGFVSAPGVPLLRHANHMVGPRWNGVPCRNLSSRPVRRALCLAAVAARDGGDVNAARDKVAKAKARLVKAECELDAAQEADPVDVQRIAKAELGVAKAELGVAKAEWQAAPENDKAAFLANIAKAELGVAKAEWQAAPDRAKAVFLANVETARIAYEKVLNAPTATPQQATVLTVKTKTGKDRKTEHTSTIKFFSEAGFKSFASRHDIWHMKKVKGRPDERISLITSLVDAVNASQQPNTYLFWDNPDDILREDVSFLKGAEKNRATGLEQETTKAMAIDKTLVQIFGPLSVVNNGSSVVFQSIDGVVNFECDGLVKNTTQVLLNEAKMTPTNESVAQLKMTVRRLQDVLKNPQEYKSRPDGVLSELVGLTDVVPVMSGYCFDDAVIENATSQGIRCAITNGISYSVIAGTGLPVEGIF